MEIVPNLGSKFSQTIVNQDDVFPDYVFERLSSTLLEEIRQGYATLPLSFKGVSTVQPRHFECVLQIAGIRIPESGFASSEFWRGCITYVGAINSRIFIDATDAWRHRQTKSFAVLLGSLRSKGFMVPPLKFESSINGVTESIAPFVEFFEGLVLDAERVWLWQGWWSSNRDQRKRIRFPFFPIYQRLGRQFTERLHHACNTWATSRNASFIPILRPLAEYIALQPDSFTAEDLLRPSFTEDFWHKFAAYFISSRHEMGNELATSLSVWNAQTRKFISECLERSGLFAKPAQMPAMPKKTKSGSQTQILQRDDGVDVKGRLITLVPLHCTDDQALNILLKEIREEIRSIERWAESEFARFCDSVDSRESLAAQGAVRQIQKVGANSNGHKMLVARDNPLALANAAAIFLHFGYQTHNDIDIGLLLPKPLPETALKLGIPTAGSLLPHLTLLVHDHPAITSSFLEKLELYDKHGNMRCLQVLDGITKLVGVKDRAGPSHAEQQITLTPRGIEVVRRIIQATQPLREYLKARNDDNWRFLLLSSGKSFGYPSPVKNLSGITTSPGIRMKSVASLERSGLTRPAAESLAERFTLATLRASVGVRIYLDTGSVQAMSEALGHSEYNPRILDHYLPLQIQRFFRERWIRIFQTSLVVEAIKGTDFILETTGLTSIQELDEFLSNHSFKRLDPLSEQESPTGKAEVAFGVSAGTLSLLFGLQKAVRAATRPVSGRALYWSMVAERICDYISSPESGREDLRNLVKKAQDIQVHESFGKFLYV